MNFRKVKKKWNLVVHECTFSTKKAEAGELGGWKSIIKGKAGETTRKSLRYPVREKMAIPPWAAWVIPAGHAVSLVCVCRTEHNLCLKTITFPFLWMKRESLSAIAVTYQFAQSIWVLCLFVWLVCWGRTSIYNPSYPGTHSLDKTGLIIRGPPLYQVLGLKGAPPLPVKHLGLNLW